MYLKGSLEILIFHIDLIQHTHTLVSGDERGEKIIRN